MYIWKKIQGISEVVTAYQDQSDMTDPRMNSPPESSITHTVNVDWYQRTLSQRICWLGTWLDGQWACV